MSKSKFVLSDFDDDDVFAGGVLIKTPLEDYRIAAHINLMAKLDMTRSYDLKVRNRMGEVVKFRSFYYKNDIGKIKFYLINNVGEVENNPIEQSQMTLFQENRPLKYYLFGKRNSSFYPVGDIIPDYYFIIKHPHSYYDFEKFIEKLEIPKTNLILAKNKMYKVANEDIIDNIEYSFMSNKDNSMQNIRQRILTNQNLERDEQKPKFIKKTYDM
ncbi:MAG: hypothetical protein ACOXZK_06960 [Bacteroidales bacterium]|nr:hypothetical protein [Bacteroidales bacterium]